MTKKILLCLVILFLLVLGVYVVASRTFFNKKSERVATRYKFPKSIGGLVATGDPYKAGEPVLDISTASEKAHFEVRAPKALDLTPEIRYDNSYVLIIYPNGVLLIEQSDPEYVKWRYQVALSNGEPPATSSDLEAKMRVAYPYWLKASRKGWETADRKSDKFPEYREINGHPGTVLEAGYNDTVGGGKEARGPSIVWFQDNVEFILRGPAGMKLDKLIDIAVSTM